MQPRDAQPGNLVELKTSSPPMVIGSVKDEIAKCYYYSIQSFSIVEIDLPIAALKEIREWDYHTYRNEI